MKNKQFNKQNNFGVKNLILTVMVFFYLFSYCQTNIGEPTRLTVNQIQQLMEQRFEGKIVSIKYVDSRQTYTVSLLQRDGHVYRLLLAANTGRLISRTQVVHQKQHTVK